MILVAGFLNLHALQHQFLGCRLPHKCSKRYNFSPSMGFVFVYTSCGSYACILPNPESHCMQLMISHLLLVCASFPLLFFGLLPCCRHA